MVLHDGPLIRSPWGRVALPGTSVGDQKRDEFIHDFLAIVGDCRLLWLPRNTETTTSTTVDRNARTITYDATIAARKSPLGSGVAVTFDGTDQEGDTPDTANLSFGDGAADLPFSVLALIKPTEAAAVQTIL